MNFISVITLLAQDDTTESTTSSAAGAIGGGVGGIIGMVVGLLMIISLWKIFTKAGQPGWASLIPIYNYIIWCKIVGRPLWWVLLFFICFPVVFIILCIDLAKSFGQGAGFGIGMVFLPFIFFPMLGFGGATYVGPSAAPRAVA